MKFETIMNRINAGLSGDSSRDIPYLMQQAETYKDHTHGTEVLNSISQQIYAMLPEDQKAQWDQAVQGEQSVVKRVMQEVQPHLIDRDYQQAAELLENLVAQIEGSGLYTDDESSVWYSFDNFLEDMLYRELYHPEREVRYTPDDYADVYFVYGNLLFEMGRREEAEAALLKASRWNPMRVDVLYALGEFHKQRHQWPEFYAITVKGMERAWQTEYLTRGYRNLGYYFIEQGDYELATALFFLSLGFEPDNQAAQAELGYLARLTEGKVIPPTLERLSELFEQNQIQMGPNPMVVQMAISIGNEAAQEGALDAAVYFYSIAWELTGNEEIKAQMDALAAGGLV